MTIPRPTGRLVMRDGDAYMVLDRIFAAPIEDVWASMTRPVPMQSWVGTWTGRPDTGAMRFHRSVDPEAEWEDVAVLECAAPHRFLGDFGPPESSRRLYLHLNEASSHTTVSVGQRLRSPREEARVGVELDYYLDRLVAYRLGRKMPEWDDYYPAMLSHYRELVATG